MKKTICLLLALVLCFMLAACGSSGTGNEDYDYIISLLDRGEYDMAIQVIEMLRTGSADVPTQTEVPAAVPDSAQEAQTEPGADIGQQAELNVELKANGSFGTITWQAICD